MVHARCVALCHYVARWALVLMVQVEDVCDTSSS
jgi:hypothetical protein